MTDFTPSQLARMDTARLANYRANLDFYQGSQWQQTSRHRQLVFNYAKVSIDKVTSFLMQGLGFACYPNPTNSHRILAATFGDNLTITHTQVSGDTQDEPPVHVREAAFDWDNLLRGIDNLSMQYDPNLEEPDQAEKRADALLRHEAQKSLGGQIIVPTNCGQELYDVVTVTDTRVGLADKNFRVLAIQTDYDRRQGKYEQRLTIGAP
jgi:hypothetical protein